MRRALVLGRCPRCDTRRVPSAYARRAKTRRGVHRRRARRARGAAPRRRARRVRARRDRRARPQGRPARCRALARSQTTRCEPRGAPALGRRRTRPASLERVACALQPIPRHRRWTLGRRVPLQRLRRKQGVH